MEEAMYFEVDVDKKTLQLIVKVLKNYETENDIRKCLRDDLIEQFEDQLLLI